MAPFRLGIVIYGLSLIYKLNLSLTTNPFAENDVYLDVAIYHHRGGKAGVSLRIGFTSEDPVNNKIMRSIHTQIAGFFKKIRN